ncbi:MAG TPA: S24 family peptidase [Candidatus Saccharimonadales bacterium]
MAEHDQPEPTGVSIHTGFPNPGIDTSLRGLDLNQLLIEHTASTYFFRVQGSDWEKSGVFEGDIALVDRALDPRATDTVMWWNDQSGEFSISTYKKMPQEAQIWGVITATIHQHRKVNQRGPK